MTSNSEQESYWQAVMEKCLDLIWLKWIRKENFTKEWCRIGSCERISFCEGRIKGVIKTRCTTLIILVTKMTNCQGTETLTLAVVLGRLP